MSLEKPPALATWLLHRFRIPETNAPLAGDLLEEFHSGRSRAWYWRQTVVAIAAQLRHNARTYSGRLTAILAAWLFQATIAYTLWRFHLPSAPRPLYLALAAVIVVSLPVIIVIALRKRRTKRLRSALGRLAYWTALPFLETGLFLRLRCRGLQTDPVADVADLALTVWTCLVYCFGSYLLIALFVSFSQDGLLVLEILFLVECLISEIASPRPKTR